MVRDSQKSKVYKWEGETFGRQADMPVWYEAQCVKFINEAYKWFTDGDKNTPPVKIKFKNFLNARVTSGYFCPDDNLIAINRRTGTNPFVCLHELAHYIDFHQYADNPSHGESFVEIYITLLIKFTDFTKIELIDSAEKFGVKFSNLRFPDQDYIPQLIDADLEKQKYIHYAVYSYDLEKWIPIIPNNIMKYLNEDYAVVNPTTGNSTVFGYDYDSAWGY